MGFHTVIANCRQMVVGRGFMKVVGCLILFVVAFVLWPADRSLRAATLFHTDTFNDGPSSLGWMGDSPTVHPNGGAQGQGDGILRAISVDGSGPGSRLAIFNNDPAWTGNYANAGVTAIQVDFKNAPTSAQALDMRLVLFSGTSRWTSSEPFSLPRDDAWYTAVFPVSVDSLTRVAGSITFATMLADIDRIMFRHDGTTPSAQGTPVSATVDFDNIILLGEKEVFPDANGDGIADGQDFNIWYENLNRSGTNLATGDFNSDRMTNERDLEIWNAHRFSLSAGAGQAATVPEPTGVCCSLALILGAAFARRRNVYGI